MGIQILHLNENTIDDALAAWRSAVESGFQLEPDDFIRELYAKVILLQSHYQITYTEALSLETAAKRNTELVLRRLMKDVYPSGSVASRETKAKADGKYVEIYSKWMEAERSRIIAEGYLNACQGIANQISRDMNFRLKN